MTNARPGLASPGQHGGSGALVGTDPGVVDSGYPAAEPLLEGASGFQSRDE
ncbi:hypothetical protein [Streptomyces sp. NPDC005303]|uniref:hypothetical protein n=1 Tax=Streptomyces sp. NPDC005303 TaxID=3155713 RepID=UPI0033A8885C